MRTIDLLAELIGDSRFPDIESFDLDHLTELRQLEGLTIDDLELTQLSATRVEAQAQDFTLVLSGGQLAPVGSAQELADAIDGAFGSGAFTVMELSIADQPVLSFALTDDGYVFRSGQQTVHFVADWPETLSELFSNFHALVGALSDANPPRTNREVLEHIQSNANWSGFTLYDAGQELVSVSSTPTSVSISAESLSVSVQQERQGDALHLDLQITGEESSTESLTKVSSANLADLRGRVPELAEALEITLSQQDVDQIEALVDHTYVHYQLDQEALGPFSFQLDARIDHFYSDLVPVSLRGTVTDDLLSGTATDELFLGLAGDDLISGGAGEDTARLYGLSTSFSVEMGPDGTTVRDRRVEGAGADYLTEIERVHFDDLSLDISALPLTDAHDIQSFIELYIAYFDRAPDALGLNFWASAFADGLTLEAIAGQFGSQPETLSAYPPGTSNEVFATTVYNNVLGRTPDQAGIDFWVRQLDLGNVSRDQFILSLLQGAKSELKPELGAEFVAQQRADQAYLEHKIDIGAYFAVHKGMSDVANAATAMAQFDGTESSIRDAVAAIDGFFAAALEPTTGAFLMPLVGVLDDQFAII